MACIDFEKEKDKFREYYSKNRRSLEGAAKLFEGLILSLTTETENLETPTVLSRVKDQDESIKKFERKYQTAVENDQTASEIKNLITDLIGIRVICYYETDIAKVVGVLRDNFEVIKETDKSAELESKENEFGYKGHHLDLRISGSRANLPEYARYKELCFEVQVRSTIQDAWSVLDHKIKYKKSIPQSLRRQINALAALFEIADREFTNLRDLTEKLKENKAGKVQTDLKGNLTPIDVFEFLAVVEPLFKSYQFPGYKSDGFVQEINKMNKDMGAEEFKKAMDESMPKVTEYTAFQKKSHGNKLNPYTQIRHVLFLHNRESFQTVLHEYQRKNFEEWLEKSQKV